MSFRPLPEHQLDTLGDDDLIAHARAARDAGRPDQAALAIRVLVFGHWHRVERRVALKVPKHDVEDVAGDVMFSAVRSAFEGESVGEFVAWLNTITKRRIADYHRKPRPNAESLDVGEDGLDVAGICEQGLVETQLVIDNVLATLSEVHRDAVRLHVIDGVPAKEVAARLGLNEDNVAQIASRFRRKLAAELGDDS